MKGLIKAVFSLLVILLIGGGAYYGYKAIKAYDPLTVTVDGAPVVNADRVVMSNNKNVVIGYELGSFVSAQRCNVNVYANSDEAHNFAFSVNDISVNWSDVGELTAAFDIEYTENGFVLNYPPTIAEILGRVYTDSEITSVPDVDLTEFEYFMLVVSTADGKYTRSIYFSSYIGVDGVELPDKEILL